MLADAGGDVTLHARRPELVSAITDTQENPDYLPGIVLPAAVRATVEDLGLEEIVRANGGVPAVVGILDGVPSVGLLPHEIEQMCSGSPKRVSRRDIAFMVGKVGFLFFFFPFSAPWGFELLFFPNGQILIISQTLRCFFPPLRLGEEACELERLTLS